MPITEIVESLLMVGVHGDFSSPKSKRRVQIHTCSHVLQALCPLPSFPLRLRLKKAPGLLA